MNRMYLVLGDWSDDGHGKSEKLLIESNKTVEEIQNAYKDSCKLTGISFNGDNEDYTQTNRFWVESSNYRIAVEYEEPKLTSEVLEVLEKFKCPKGIIENYNEEPYYRSYIDLWDWFVKLSLPDLEFNIVKEDDGIPCINGYWNKNLNVSFGYGLYI